MSARQNSVGSPVGPSAATSTTLRSDRDHRVHTSIRDVSLIRVVRRSHSGARRRSRAASPSRSTERALARGSSPPCPSRTSGTPSWPTTARVHQPRRRHQPQGTDATAPTPKGLKSDRAVGRYLSGAKFREAITGATTLDETQNRWPNKYIEYEVIGLPRAARGKPSCH